MAKKKGKKSWKAIMVVVIAALIVNIIKMAADDSSLKSGIKAEGLELVVIPEGMANETWAYMGFTVYFNRDTHLPNCTSYELTRQETTGEVKRAKSFDTDPNISGSATPEDYTYSGFDRGHMVPAGDMKWDTEAMRECFYMTNIVPQKKALNSGAWNKLEAKVRDWADRDSAVIVITGPIVSEADMANTIGENRVVVPSKLFKVVLAPYASPARAIAFIYPNEKAKGGLEKYATSVDDVETATGMDFFSSLPDDIEDTVEARFDLNQWNKR